MIRTINVYINELNRLEKRQEKDPITTINTEYEYNIATYEIVSFLRGLIDPVKEQYIEQLNNILNKSYKDLIDNYNNLPLSPENQQSLITRSKELLRSIRLLIDKMLKDILERNLYFISEPLSIDNFYRNINYFLYILDSDTNK